MPIISNLFKKKTAKNPISNTVKLQPESDVTLKTISARNLVAADSIECSPDYVRINGDTYCCAYFIHQIPPVVYMGWLDDILTLGDIDTSKHIVPIPKEEAIKALVGRTTELISQGYDSDKSGDIRHYISGRAELVEEYKEFTRHVSRNRDALFNVSIIITVHASSLKELKQKCGLLEKKLGGSGSSFSYCRKALFRQDEAIRSTFPLGIDFLNIQRSFNTAALVCSFPAREADIIHKEGIFLGYNEITGSPIILDLFQYTNANLGIYGPPGSGKSYTVKLLSKRSIGREKIAIFDPGSQENVGEYTNIVRLFKGARIEVSPASKDIINPLDINITETVEEDGTIFREVDIAGKVDACKTLFRYMLEGKKTNEVLSLEELAVLEESIQELYSDKKITNDINSLYDEYRVVNGQVEYGRFLKEMPTLTDLLEKLRAKNMNKLVNVLRTYTKEGTFPMFDGQTTVNLQNYRVISFDLSKLPQDSETLKVAYYMVFNWVISNFVNTDVKQKKKVILDEAWIFMDNEDTAGFIEKIARGARKRNCSICIASQKVEDFTATKKGRAVLHNSAAKILLQQDRTAIDQIIEEFQLNVGQATYLRSLYGKKDAGRGLLIVGNEIIPMRVKAFDFEDRLINTDPNRIV